MQQPEDLIYERFLFPGLVHDEVPSAFLRNFDERIAGHVLHTFVCLVHEFKQLVDNRLQEFPVRFEETRILANNVHDIGGHNGFVILSTFNFAKAQKVFDDSDQESLLGILV